MTNLMLILICVLAISSGQLLFKQVGLELELTNSWFSWRVLLYLSAAFCVYTLATLLWVHLLRVVPLNQAYPFMALSFVIVPLLSAWFFNEHFVTSHAIGIMLIVSGVIVISRSGS